MAETIYPELNNIDKDRAKFMLSKYEDIERKLAHYEKIKKKWVKAEKIVLGIGLTASASVAIISLTIGIIGTAGAGLAPAVGSAIAAITGGVASIKGFITLIISKGIIGKKIVHYRHICEAINTYLNRVYIYIEKSRSDGKISIEELENFNKLIAEMDDALNKIKTKHSENLEETFKSLSQKDIKKVRQELREQQKMKDKNEYRSFLEKRNVDSF